MRDIPAALAAAISGQYRIERRLGAGGMATVYLAHDLKHDRDVALKVLRDDIAAAIGGERFLTEIRTTARLRHPHILPLFDSGSAAGTLFYVMPFVEGESLRDRLRRDGPLEVGIAVRVLRQVADALAYAHARGIIHRDIKPDNVLMSGDDAFVADFGIARAVPAQDAGVTMTGATVMIGTPSYMSPEQIVGGAVDHRTDIYAFGALAYEVLTGSPPFTGNTQEIVAAQLGSPPDAVTRRRPGVPSALADVVDRCLAKDPIQRWQSVRDLLQMLDSAAASSAPPARRRDWPRPAWWYAAAGLFIISALAAGWYVLSASRDARGSFVVGRITHVTSDAGLELDPAVSPDGRTLAYVAGLPGQMRIFIKELSGGRSVPLTDDGFSGGQRWPQWSPDGSRIVFQSGRQPLVVPSSLTTPGMLFLATPLGGTAARLLKSLPGDIAIGPSWSPDGSRIVFGGVAGLYAVAADGDGVPKLMAAGANVHSPRWSSDGSRIVYVVNGDLFTFGEDSLGNVSTSSLMVYTTATGRTAQITSGEWLDTNPVWMPDNRTLAFVSSRGGGRDVYTVRLRTDATPEEDPQRLTSGLNAHGISLKNDGKLLVYSSYAPSANIWSVEIPETGSVSVAEARQVTFGNEKIEKLVVSPDGLWLAYDSDRNGVADIWRAPLAGGRPEQLTHGPNHSFVNDWSRDGSEIAFHAFRQGQRDVLVMSADGARTEPVATRPVDEQHAGWGPNDNSIVYDAPLQSGGRTQLFIVTRPRRGQPWGAPRQLTTEGGWDPKCSPDGRLIAYTSNGQLLVVRPDGTGRRVVVAIRAPGDPEPSYPVWSRDNRTIYYKIYDPARQSAIWGVPASGGEPRLMVRFDDPSRRSLRREFATDGTRFYFTIAHDESDLWSMEIGRK